MPQDKQRVLALDLARGLAVLFMIAVHALVTYGRPEVLHSPFGWAIDFLGSSPAAPVFMALMGVSSYYSRNTEFWPGVRRGLHIIFLGYVLNFLRGVLPVFLAARFLPSKAAAIPPDVMNYLDAFLELDILQFAGLALIAMAALKRLRVGKYWLLALAAAVAAASPHLWGVTVRNPAAAHLLDFLWGDKPVESHCIGNLVSFPFFPWFTFVLLGMFVGETLSRSQNPAKTLRNFGLAGLATATATLIYILPNFMYHLGDYYHCRPWATLFHCGFVLAWVWLCDIAVRKIKPNRAFDLLYDWSRNVNRIYMLQWTFIMWGACLAWGFNSSGFAGTAALIALMSVLSHYANRLILSFNAARSKSAPGQ